MKIGMGKYIGLATLAGISLTCDSNTKTLSSTIDNNTINIRNTFTPPLDTNTAIATLGTTRDLGESTSQEITDTLIQSEISPQNITTKDTIQIANSTATSHTTDTMQRGPNKNIIILETSSNENIKKILSKEECKDMCDKQITKAIVEIVPETNKIEFDITYMRGQAYNLFTNFFTIQDTETGIHLIFSKIQQKDEILVTQHMDNMKKHIKEKNSWIGIFVGKGKLKDYIMNGSEKNEKSNIQKLYEIMTNKGSIKYEGGESQFKKDIESVINLY